MYPPDSAKPTPAVRLRILVVDDHEQSAAALSRLPSRQAHVNEMGALT